MPQNGSLHVLSPEPAIARAFAFLDLENPLAETLNHPKDWSLSTWINAISLLMSTGVLGAVLWVGMEYGSFSQRIMSIDGRLTALEARAISPEAARRVAVLEANQVNQGVEIRRMADQLTSRLDRIENKIDRQSGQ